MVLVWPRATCHPGGCWGPGPCRAGPAEVRPELCAPSVTDTTHGIRSHVPFGAITYSAAGQRRRLQCPWQGCTVDFLFGQLWLSLRAPGAGGVQSSCCWLLTASCCLPGLHPAPGPLSLMRSDSWSRKLTLLKVDHSVVSHTSPLPNSRTFHHPRKRFRTHEASLPSACLSPATMSPRPVSPELPVLGNAHKRGHAARDSRPHESCELEREGRLVGGLDGWVMHLHLQLGMGEGDHPVSGAP